MGSNCLQCRWHSTDLVWYCEHHHCNLIRTSEGQWMKIVATKKARLRYFVGTCSSFQSVWKWKVSRELQPDSCIGYPDFIYLGRAMFEHRKTSGYRIISHFIWGPETHLKTPEGEPLNSTSGRTTSSDAQIWQGGKVVQKQSAQTQADLDQEAVAAQCWEAIR